MAILLPVRISQKGTFSFVVADPPFSNKAWIKRRERGSESLSTALAYQMGT